jgi:hypothetical protein
MNIYSYGYIDMNIQQLFQDAQNDPSLLSSIDINDLLNSLENKNNDYLIDKTLNDIQNEIINVFNQNNFPKEKTKELCEKLVDYRYVDEIYEIHKGKHVRWIKPGNNSKLTNGGIVVDVKFLDNGTHVLCMNNQRRFIQYKFDDSLTFQKLSLEEQLILMAYEKL